jgi:hypothetical protein
MNVVAVDPGGTTGIARFLSRPGEHEAFTLEHGHDQDWLAENIEFYDLLVCEDFIISAATARKTQTGSKQALETIGVARYLARHAGVRFKLQTPSAASTFDPKFAKLRRIGWDTPGPDHMRAASRHLLLACAEEGLIDLKQLLEV